jgi:hypothetical protein
MLIAMVGAWGRLEEGPLYLVTKYSWTSYTTEHMDAAVLVMGISLTELFLAASNFHSSGNRFDSTI